MARISQNAFYCGEIRVKAQDKGNLYYRYEALPRRRNVLPALPALKKEDAAKMAALQEEDDSLRSAGILPAKSEDRAFPGRAWELEVPGGLILKSVTSGVLTLD